MKASLEALYLLLFLPTVFSLRCFQCSGSSSSCRMSRKACPAYETSCISLAYRSRMADTSIVDTVVKGCASPVLCNQTSAVDTGLQYIYMTATCCESDYCNLNSFSALSVVSNSLQCNSCTDPKTCPSSQQPLTCSAINNQCVDVVTETFNNASTSQKMYSRGCGNGEACNALMAYNTGSVRMYTQYSCCNAGDFCNKNQVTVTIRQNSNGILCWGCNETGRNECATQNQVIVRCTGTLIRCMEMFGGPDRKTLKKGCCTEDLCSDTYPSLAIPSDTEIQCCAGNLCNKWAPDYPCPEDYNSSWRPLGSPGLLLTILCFSLLRILL